MILFRSSNNKHHITPEISQSITMGDTTHRESSPTTHPQLSNIAMQLLKLQTNSDSPVTQLGLSHIAMQLQQFQTYHSEKEAELKKQISALEA